MSETVMLICSALAVVCAIVLLILLRKGWVSEATLEAVAELLEAVPEMEGNIIDDIARYAAIAVRTVEQAVKVGIVEKTNDARKAAAVEIVRELAAEEWDAEAVNDLSDKTIGDVVDAAVNRMGKDNETGGLERTNL